MDVLLPFGLTTPDGHRFRNARIGPLTGEGELLCAGVDNPVRAMLGLLRTSLLRLGPFARAELSAGVIAQLLPLDREFLAVQLIRATFGDAQLVTIWCPLEGCETQLDIEIDLSDVEAVSLPEALVADVTLPTGSSVRLRLPSSAVQSTLHDEPIERRERELVMGCLVEAAHTLSRGQVAALPDELITRLAATLVERSPVLDLSVEMSCVECGGAFEFTYEPGQQLLASLRASKRSIMREVHYLAYHYHWPLGEILELARPTRREFLDLLQEELDGGRSLR